ncbi:MAG: glycosyltransferase family 1 protein, partial [Porphyrobacter sp.]|nr:glycosyltransferase family 1 protein [Porphyrobacter sp.]
PSVRLFEAGACGTPILSDRWPGIEEIFAPGEEIVLADTTAEIIAALAQDSTAMGAAARARVLAHHSAARRAQQLEHDLVRAAGLDIAQPDTRKVVAS